MQRKSSHDPIPVPQVMVSSTFTDLQHHRAALIECIHGHKLHANVMENDSARLVDVIESSLQMVRHSAAYIGVVSLKYGQTPECPTRNPDKLSITELEFNEAQRLERPILLFMMGDDHPVKKADIEKDPEKEKKLNDFRERAKKVSPDSSVNRVYAIFNSLEEFKDKLGSSLAELSRHLEFAADDTAREKADEPESTGRAGIPTPPAFYAEPDYIGSHQFVGRDAEIQALSDWALPADPTNLLLFEAIGGNGKSMLTWQWAKYNSITVRPDWAGRFWYSFYEKGAIMGDFCQRALAYMTGQPLNELEKKKTAELKESLLAQLHAKPWLLILDGLERVLVAYHRFDAAEIADEDVDVPTDKIVNRDPRNTIRDEDNDILRALTAASPSKILVSSRLTPRVLLNPSGQPLNGVKRVPLPGLRPRDAESLLRSCGIQGDSAAIQSYLTSNCDNHPLVIGVLGGLINNYLPDRGNFDAWVTDQEGGARLDLASLDLTQRRNHILRFALDVLPSASRELLCTLALLSESADYETLKAFNPHLPPEPEEIAKPEMPERHGRWNNLSAEQKAERRKNYESSVNNWKNYENAMQRRLASAEFLDAPKKLAETIRDLEQRGLLQYEDRTRRHDLHPVVRGVAAGGMRLEDKQRYGQRVVDHFSSLPHDPYEQAEILEDLRPGLNIIRTLLKLGRVQQAADTYWGDLANALGFNLEAFPEVLALLRPFFSAGWSKLPNGVEVTTAGYLANDAALALGSCGESREALGLYGAILRSELENEDWQNIDITLSNIAIDLCRLNLLAQQARVNGLALQLATLIGHPPNLFRRRLDQFVQQSRLGKWADAEATWKLLDPMGRQWPRALYRPGDAECFYVDFQYCTGTLDESQLDAAQRLAAKGKNLGALRHLHRLRGAWRLDQGQWALAATSFADAVRMARERGIQDEVSETGLVLAKFRLGQLAEPRREAERLAQLRDPAHRQLAQLWLAIGNTEQTKFHALAAYRWAWSDGEPFVHRYELTKTTELLEQMQIPIPVLPPYDAMKDEPFPWEADVCAAIEKLRADKKAQNKSDSTTGNQAQS